MNKKAFTLIELLLTIAVLSIVTATTAPYFFNGAKNILEDAKKSNMLTAYQSARTGANILMSLTSAKAKSISGNLDNLNQEDEIKNLEYYSPKYSRTFEGKNGNKFVFGAKVTKDLEGKSICIMTYVAGDDPTQDGILVTPPGSTDKTVHEALNNLWETVFAAQPQQ